MVQNMLDKSKKNLDGQQREMHEPHQLLPAGVIPEYKPLL
jgi:hypothetical protein